MQFRVGPAVGADPSTPPRTCACRPITPLPAATMTRPLALIEEMSTYFDGRPGRGAARVPSTAIRHRRLGSWTGACGWTRSPRIPRSATPRSGSSTTPRPTPIRCTSTRCSFEVVNRQDDRRRRGHRRRSRSRRDRRRGRPSRGRRAQGHRDRLPGRGHPHQGQVRQPGQFVWHCHIVEHEDNEMMRPYRVGPEQPGQPMSTSHTM